MTKQRVIETTDGIQDKITVEMYDRFAKIMRDKGYENIDVFVKNGIEQGSVLEIGPGPGYIGLEWLKLAKQNSKLTALEISKEMIRFAQKNAQEYGYSNQAKYIEGNALKMPFVDNSFDGVFSSGSLHEWEKPLYVIEEAYRVLKSGSNLCITDLRRDANPALKWLIYLTMNPKEMRPGFLTSMGAAYTTNELTEIMRNSSFKTFSVTKDFFGLTVRATKE